MYALRSAIACVVVCTALLACHRPPGLRESANLERCLSQARRLFAEGRIDSSLYYVNRCLQIDRNYAPAHHLLGEIYLHKDGIYNRRLSAQALRKAVKAEGDNPQYHYSLGLTLERQGYFHNALQQFEKAAELDPNDSRPLVKMAEINKMIGLRYNDDKYFHRALAASQEAARLSKDPSQYYQQAVVLYQMGKYDSSARAVATALEIGGDPSLLADGFLLLGTDLVRQGNYDSANVAFNRAREYLSPVARDEMDDVRYLMPTSEYNKWSRRSLYKQKRAVAQFWGRLDPDPTTSINERKLEHYARFVHAQLTFSIPEKSIEGWKTRRGEMYIRYGPPTEMVFSLGEGAPDPPKWIWRYDNLEQPATFVFEDTFLSGDFDFPFPSKEWTASDYERDPSRLAATLRQAMPQNFTYAPGTGPLNYLYLARQFKGSGGKTDLEVFIAIPYTELEFSRRGEEATATIAIRQALRYQSWRLADSSRALRTYTIRASQTENPNLSISDRLSVSAYPDSMIFAISVKDTLSGRVGIGTNDIRLRDFYTGRVELSDIVLARRILSPPGKTRFRRNELGIFSNLDNRYFAGEPVWLYFEIYNLERGPDGRTSYTLNQSVTQIPKGGIVGALGKVLGRKDLEKVATSYSGGGTYSDERRILNLDLSGLEAGRYLVSIEVEDNLSTKKAIVSEEVVIYR